MDTEVILNELKNMDRRSDERHAHVMEALADHEKRVRSLEKMKYALHGVWALILVAYGALDQKLHGR